MCGLLTVMQMNSKLNSEEVELACDEMIVALV